MKANLIIEQIRIRLTRILQASVLASVAQK